MKKTESKRENEKEVVAQMIRLYCRFHHGGKPLCPECEDLCRYAQRRIDKCPFMETKTFCSCCRVHCYQKEYREKIRTVMRWSGPRMLFFHPIMAIRHLILTVKEKRRLRNET